MQQQLVPEELAICASASAMLQHTQIWMMLTCMEAVYPLGSISAYESDKVALAVLRVATTLPGPYCSTHSTLRCARLEVTQQLLSVALVDLDFGIIWFAVCHGSL